MNPSLSDMLYEALQLLVSLTPYIAIAIALVAAIWLIAILWKIGKAADEAFDLTLEAANNLGKMLREK